MVKKSKSKYHLWTEHIPNVLKYYVFRTPTILATKLARQRCQCLYSKNIENAIKHHTIWIQNIRSNLRKAHDSERKIEFFYDHVLYNYYFTLLVNKLKLVVACQTNLIVHKDIQLELKLEKPFCSSQMCFFFKKITNREQMPKTSN